jgi:hypothetical protein
MLLVKILKRKDASSIIVAIVIGSVLLQFVETITNRWATKLAHVNYGPQYFHWKEDYLLPVVWFVLELIVLEVLCWLYVGLTGSMKKK